MALKFLNKKGWHTGSLRNIENVWKAEQKHDAEQKKLEELRKQINEERERSEFRLLQEQAGLVPKQERLDFLYDSGLAVGKGTSDGFKALEPAFPKSDPQPPSASSSSSAKQQPSVPGALFEEKPQSANDAWRKLHSDPLLLIRQREQEALARVKNNPIQMAMIRKSVETKKHKEKTSESKKLQEKHHHKKSKHRKHSSSERRYDPENIDVEREERRRTRTGKSSKYDGLLDKGASSLERDIGKKRTVDKYKDQPASARSDSTTSNVKTQYGIKRNHDNIDETKCETYYSEGRMDCESGRIGREERNSYHPARNCDPSDVAPRRESHHKQHSSRRAHKLSEEERAARLQEMQMDAELHEEQRWKRLKKADENDAEEAIGGSTRNFLDAARKSVYGAEKRGSSTIEESVRRRTHYLQSRSEVGEGNAFRR